MLVAHVSYAAKKERLSETMLASRNFLRRRKERERPHQSSTQVRVAVVPQEDVEFCWQVKKSERNSEGRGERGEENWKLLSGRLCSNSHKRRGCKKGGRS